MRTLAIETATEACSIALFDGDQLIANDHRVLGRGHAERLVPMIAALPEKGRSDRILVSLGPGSFTGVRIGIATATALGFAWQAEVLGYPTLSLIAAMAAQKHPGEGVTVCMNGGHGEWFIQNFDAVGMAQDSVRSLAPVDAKIAAIHQLISGNRAQELVQLLGSKHQVFVALPDASQTLFLRETELTNNISPIYGRGPDAKLPSQ